MERKKAFTLVELLVVISIIALLMAILIPALGRAREYAKRTVCGTRMRQIGIAVFAYASDNSDLLPFYEGYDPSYKRLFTGPAADKHHPYAAYRGDTDGTDAPFAGPPPEPMKMACLYVRKYIQEPKVFYCPSNRNPSYMYESYTKPLAPNTSSEWGTLPQVFNVGKNQWVRTGLCYYPIDETMGPLQMEGLGGKPVPRYTARRFTVLSRKYPYLTDVMWTREDLSHKAGIDGQNYVKNAGVNALFKDGHVRYVTDHEVMVNGVEETLFNNHYWEAAEELETFGIDDRRYLYYHIFKMIE